MTRKGSPTLTQIAKDLDLSPSAISHALSRRVSTSKISEATRLRVVEYCKKVGYRPHRAAQVLRQGRSNTIGILHYVSSGPLNSLKLQHLVQSLKNTSFKIQVNDVLWFANNADDAAEALLDSRVEGIIVNSPTEISCEKQLQLLQDAGIPLVSMGGQEHSGVPRFISDKHQGFELLIKHLKQLGKKRLTYLAYHHENQPLPWHIEIGIKGYKDVCKKLGFADKDCQVEMLSFDDPVFASIPLFRRHPYLFGREAMKNILKTKPLPDVVLCNNDSWAVGALHACARAGIRVPDDIAITGFENEPAGEFAPVPLTTVTNPIDVLSQMAVDRLLDIMKNPANAPKAEETITVPCELIVRESCGSALK